LFMFISEISMNTSTYFVFAKSLIYVMKLITIFGIKLYQKLAILLTMSSRKYPSRESKTHKLIITRRIYKVSYTDIQ